MNLFSRGFCVLDETMKKLLNNLKGKSNTFFVILGADKEIWPGLYALTQQSKTKCNSC